MTRRAVVSRAAVFLSRDRGHLASLLRTRADRVTIVTANALSGRVFAMTEDGFEDITARRCSSIRRELVTDVTRADLALGRVTGVTGRMCLNADRYRSTGTRRFMTRRATLRRTAFAGVVRRVHELHVESLDKFFGKLFHRGRGRIHVRVADNAHRLLFGICELANVTSDA